MNVYQFADEGGGIFTFGGVGGEGGILYSSFFMITHNFGGDCKNVTLGLEER